MSDLPQGWAIVRLADITRTKSGNGKLIKGRLSSSPGPGLFPAFSASGQDVWVSTPEHEGKAIIVSAVGARCGKAFLASGRWSAVANTHIVWPDERVIDSNFLWLLLNNEHFWIKGGSAQPFVKVSATFREPLALPSLLEQRRIVTRVEELFGQLRQARADLLRISPLSARLKQAVLTAELEAITASVTWKPLESIVDHITSGSRDWSKYYGSGDAVFVLAGNVRPMLFDQRPRQVINPPADSPDARRTRIKKDDLLVTIVGANTGDVCRVDADVSNYYVCQSVAIVRLRDAAQAGFIELYLNAEKFGSGEISRAIYGQGRPHLGFADIKALPIPVVDQYRSASLVQRVKAAFASIDQLQVEAARTLLLLDQLQQRTLARLLSCQSSPP